MVAHLTYQTQLLTNLHHASSPDAGHCDLVWCLIRWLRTQNSSQCVLSTASTTIDGP